MNYDGFTKEDLILMLSRGARYKIMFPQDVSKALSEYAKAEQEHFIVLTLDGNHGVINKHIITKGLVNRTLTHPREVFRPAIADNACAIIIAHNHPSGSTSPSDEDRSITKRILDAGEIVGIPVLDHIIVGDDMYSFKEQGEL